MHRAKAKSERSKIMVEFKKDTHQYFNEAGRELISVTALMAKHGLAPDYKAVPKDVLNAKAERGSLIHEEIENYIKNGEIGFTNELQSFMHAIKKKNLDVLKSEFMVHNDITAGTVDLLLQEGDDKIIADIKTTATLHKEAVSWQLSIYAYLTGEKISRGQAFHFNNDGDLKVVEIPLKSKEQVEDLLNAERNGSTMPKQKLVGVTKKQLAELAKAEKIIQDLENRKKEAEANAKAMREALQEAMEKSAIKSFENDTLKITYIEAGSRTTIDSTRLKKEQPEIARQFEKTSTTKASIRITLKEKKNA